MIDINKAKEILESHFASVTPEEFANNLQEYCPELFEVESPDLNTHELRNEEIYQQAKKEGKLEIAPKLLQKGMSVQEVAELLELDIRLIA
jgi:predicted transposase/invertase (TIGR01784 family)